MASMPSTFQYTPPRAHSGSGGDNMTQSIDCYRVKLPTSAFGQASTSA
jgi:hypothetical protein